VTWRDERGFSLVDLLVAFALLVFVLAAITTIHQGVLQAYVMGSNKTEVQQNARVALEHVARELRQTPSALTSATEKSLTLVDQDTGLAVTYALSDAVPPALTRTTNGVTSVVIGNVQALRLDYRDASETVLAKPVATPANVFRVDITVQTASEDTVVAGGFADTRTELTTSVRLRNL
jgi:type II secretory pathway pseudopilin PulG